ncbi:hypothetical protein C7M84_022230 [Penaeus vannamei]|uniref:Uncharacterized protein n=1 Tax=Penaeus vannamei TaxID=6689 RepID=A0A3R7T0V4_PENVA|nr:hypothetical protein C7M84_022230 [Penaeus vannamei]
MSLFISLFSSSLFPFSLLFSSFSHRFCSIVILSLSILSPPSSSFLSSLLSPYLVLSLCTLRFSLSFSPSPFSALFLLLSFISLCLFSLLSPFSPFSSFSPFSLFLSFSYSLLSILSLSSSFSISLCLELLSSSLPLFDPFISIPAKNSNFSFFPFLSSTYYPLFPHSTSTSFFHVFTFPFPPTSLLFFSTSPEPLVFSHLLSHPPTTLHHPSPTLLSLFPPTLSPSPPLPSPPHFQSTHSLSLLPSFQPPFPPLLPLSTLLTSPFYPLLPSNPLPSTPFPPSSPSSPPSNPLSIHPLLPLISPPTFHPHLPLFSPLQPPSPPPSPLLPLQPLSSLLPLHPLLLSPLLPLQPPPPQPVHLLRYQQRPPPPILIRPRNEGY